jgi:hypothetical protein
MITPVYLTKKFQTISSIFEEFIDQIKHPQTQAIISYALDSLKPHYRSLGLRLVKLNSNQIEMMIPSKLRNLGADGFMLTGVMVSAGLESYKLLWKRNFFENQNVQITFQTMDWHQIRPTKSDVRIRAELPTVSREGVLAEMTKNQKAAHDIQISFFDQEDIMIGQLHVQADFQVSQLLEWK